MNTIPLTSDQAAKVAALQPGEKCELTFVSDWQPSTKWKVVDFGTHVNGGENALQVRATDWVHYLKPPYQFNVPYGVLEPCAWSTPHEPQYDNLSAFYHKPEIVAKNPEWAIRSHIIIHSQTPKIEDSKLVWDAVVERVKP
jgi:hypothetical protein